MSDRLPYIVHLHRYDTRQCLVRDRMATAASLFATAAGSVPVVGRCHLCGAPCDVATHRDLEFDPGREALPSANGHFFLQSFFLSFFDFSGFALRLERFLRSRTELGVVLLSTK